jgi:ABC-type dipeptide/oligopeptide/nickel transport system permease component
MSRFGVGEKKRFVHSESVGCPKIHLYNKSKLFQEFIMNIIVEKESKVAKRENNLSVEFRLIRQRLGGAVITLLVIAYLTLLGLLFAERGREHLPAKPLDAMQQSALKLIDYLFHHPATYIWNRQITPAYELISAILGRSAGLLLGSMAVALVLGVLLGVGTALSKRKLSAAVVLSLSVLGISTPSFLLAMLFWVANIYIHNTYKIKVLPSAGFGWDAHMVLPILVLAMRPMAQIAQVTYVSLCPGKGAGMAGGAIPSRAP